MEDPIHLKLAEPLSIDSFPELDEYRDARSAEVLESVRALPPHDLPYVGARTAAVLRRFFGGIIQVSVHLASNLDEVFSSKPDRVPRFAVAARADC